MALDNEEAEIEVGEMIRIYHRHSWSSWNPGRQGFSGRLNDKTQYQTHISPGSNTMRLEIEQQIKDISTTPIKAANLASNALGLPKDTLN